jgi:hypothetical protein
VPDPVKAIERKITVRKIVMTLVVVLAGLLSMGAKIPVNPLETPAEKLTETPVETPVMTEKTPSPPWQIVLTGAEEPGGGDPDGSGLATLWLNYGAGTFCWDVSWENIDEPTAGHVHIGAAGVAGPPVIPFVDPAGAFAASGCQQVDQTLLKAIIHDTDGYYVNLHNAAYPDGAIRGQLTDPPTPLP